MRYPVNSPQDDFGFTVTANNKFYFSSDRFGGVGSDDIYSFVFEKPINVIKLKGVCYDKETNAVLPGVKITLVNSKQIQTISDDKGRYSFDLENQVNYSLVSEKINYYPDHKVLTTIGLNDTDTVSLDIYLEKVVEKAAEGITLVNYDFNSSKLKGIAVIQLGKVIEKLQKNSRLKLEVASHTDSRGTDKYNLLLSKRRSEAVIEFLTTVGKINKNRILASWYGETRLINQCINGAKCTEAEHRVNRRTEIYFREK
jgi:outer membrane protein OmpA-like peptidoglycan-associated protein